VGRRLIASTAPRAVAGEGESSRVPFLRTAALTKSFGGVVAVEGASVSFERGLIHGLVGQNGAGKSTLVRMIAGAERPDSGHIEVNSAPATFASPRAALDAGVTLVAQELSLVGALSVAENLSLGRLPARAGFADFSAMQRRAERLISDSGFGLNPATVVGTLSASDQQKVEVLRAVARDARLIILDEPTSSMSVDESERVYEIARRLANSGVAVVLVSHYLEEVLAVCDLVTVMRDGRVVDSGPTRDFTPEALVERMVGESRSLRRLGDDHPAETTGTPRLATRALSGAGFENIDVDVHPGEIVAIVGLVGSGRSEFLRALWGADRATDGEMLIDGEPVRFASPRRAKEAGVAFVSESRKSDGLFPRLSGSVNITAAHARQVSRCGFVNRVRQREAARSAADRVGVRAHSLEQPITALSGGNQQKALLARWLVRSPRLFLIDEPTRGVDVVSIAQIHDVLARLAGEGMSVLMVSSDFDEALAVAHRIYVFRDGRVAGEFTAAESTKSALLASAFGTAAGSPALAR
jgi:ABC-type sugar transport system ATPase subunit